MKINRAYKTELDPNNKQRTLLAKHAGTARFAYNWGLQRKIEAHERGEKTPTAIDLHRELNALKQVDFPWMYEVSKCAPQEALRDLDAAFKHFFRRCKESNGKPGFPRFKSKSRGLGGFRLFGCITIGIYRIKLPRIGWLRLKEPGYLPGDAKINSVTVRERAGRWFISVQVEEEIFVSENQGPAIGLDLGLKSFVVGSDGSYFQSPKPLQQSLKRLQRLSKQHSHKQKGSANRRKSALKLGKLHYQIACQRSDFLHKTTTQLAKTKSVIVVEDLNVSGMLGNRHLARPISDAGWSEFVRQLDYKTTWYGSKLVRADRFFPSTKICSGCGMVKDKMPLAERTYRCGSCGLILDRDVNAARNLLNLSTASSVGFQACGDLPLGGSLKQEPNTVVI